MSETVWLQRPSGDVPWGFRLQGGRDYQAPLSVQKVTQGSVAATGLSSGDVILRIGETDTSSLTYSQAMDVIKNCGNLLQLSVSKQGGLYSQASQVDSESGTTMASGALHDLFQDMYRYTDPATFPQEGALPSAPHKQPPQQNQPSYTYNPTSQSYQPSNPTSQTYQPSNPTSQTYQPSNPTNQTYQPSNPPSQTYQPSNPTYQPSRAQTNGTAYGGPNTFTDQNYGRGYQPQPAPGSFPPTAPPSYNDVQSNREQVTYPYQPTTAPAANPYGYPHSVSSSTSELSDISSGYGAYDTKPGSRQMASPGGGIKVYTSGSPADSSSGVGSYSCETPDQAETTYQATVRADVVRQDSFPLPPPPLHSEASYGADSQTDTYTAPEPAPAAVPDTAPPPAPPCVPPPPPPPPPPPAPPAPPLPSSTPGKSWKVKQNEDTNSQQSPPTRLEQQLSNMSIGGGSDYGRQNSFPAPPTPPTYAPPAPFSPSHPPGAPPAPHYGGQSPSVQPQRSGPAMPDAVLNMAAKGEPDKKPWAYAPDMASIKDQRDKVRKRAPAGGMPKYQQLLNLPQFDDSPIVQPQQPQQQQRTPTQTPGTPDYGTGPGQANVQHLQFNSPIGMYSEDNMAEAFAGQTDGVITGVRGGGNKNDKNDVTQSPVYRMIHGLDADKARSRQVAPQQQHQQPQQQQQLHPNQQQQYRQPEVINERPRRGPAPDDELTFSGLSARSEIPSKSFHRLQSMTGGSDVDTSSIRANVTGDVDNNQIGDYDQASIRYTGRNIPSKSFRMLQSMTGPEPPTQATQPTRQRRRPQPQPEPESNPDDIVDISYVGGNIPSRSFKVLQQAMGQPDHQAQAQQPAPFSSCDSQNTDQGQGQTRTVKVIKLRSSQPAAEPSGVTDF